MFEKIIRRLTEKVLKGGAKKRKILKRKKRGGDAESHTVLFDNKKFICTEENTEEVVDKDLPDELSKTETHNVISDSVDNDVTSSPQTDIEQDGGAKKKKKKNKKRGGTSCSVPPEQHLHPVMSGGKKKRGGSSCSGGTEKHLHPVMSGGKKKRGGSSCSGGREAHTHMEMTAGGKKNITKQKKIYRQYLDKKYTKEQLLKKCRKVGIKITKKADGTVKPIKKKTIIEKILAIKFK